MPASFYFPITRHFRTFTTERLRTAIGRFVRFRYSGSAEFIAMTRELG